MSLIEKIKANHEHFLRYNNQKYERFQQLIVNSSIRKVINSIPLLLSVNEKKLPGFVDGEVPYGIANYVPDDETNKFLQGKFHISKIPVKTKDPFIEMLAVMGSVGTIAYSKKSDFDYWVCIDKRGVSKVMLENFQKKIDEIQRWAIREIKLDVHLFINDIDSIKNDIFAEDEEEAFGSTVGAVLKDEFYRSSIIIAGRTPFWWVVPRFVMDSDYEKLYNDLPEDYRENFIDLGNLYEISKSDFLGAALFQIIKSLGNPFKSIIKIGVLERYLFGPEESPLLCQKVKSSIHRGELDNKIVDSYILMFEEVYDYYDSVIEDKNLLKILRHNLYLKIDPQLSKYTSIKNSQNLPYKVMVMFTYIKEWRWTGKEIIELDNFDNWDYNKIINFWTQVQKFMLLSYQKIAVQLPNINLESKISDSDFKLLSRKIKTYFSAEENKIDHYITFKDTPFESILYIEPLDKNIDTQEWRLFKRNTESKDQFSSTTLKTDRKLIKLLVWTGINQIFNASFSRLKIQSGYSRINQNLVVELLNKISTLFSGRRIALRNEYFLHASFTLVNMIIINFNMENCDDIKEVYHIYRTSWGESYIDEYHSENDLILILLKILQDALKQKKPFEEFVAIDTPEPYKKIYRDIEKFFKDAYDFIIYSKKGTSLRMIAQLANQFISINRDDGTINIKSYKNYIQFLTANSLSPRIKINYSFYGENNHITLLKELYDTRKPKSLNLYYEVRNNNIFMFIINESGNIFTFIKQKANLEDILLYIFSFCKNVKDEINKKLKKQVINDHINFNRFDMDKFGKLSIINESKRIEEVYLLRYNKEKTTTVDIMLQKNAESLYRIKSPGLNQVDPVALKQIPVLIQHSGILSNGIPIIIDEIIFHNKSEETTYIGSSLFFLEKYKLETLIEKATQLGSSL